MSISEVISLLALFVPLILSVTAGAVKICSKLEKISVILENMVSQQECTAWHQQCPALNGSTLPLPHPRRLRHNAEVSCPVRD